MAVMRVAPNQAASKQVRWLLELLARKPRKLAAVALANKMARMVWAMMPSGEAYGRRPELWPEPAVGAEGAKSEAERWRSVEPTNREPRGIPSGARYAVRLSGGSFAEPIWASGQGPRQRPDT